MKRSVIISTIIIFLGLVFFTGCILLSPGSKNKKAEGATETTTTEAPIITGWVEEDEGTMYLNSAGDATKGIAEIDGKTYSFSDDGYLNTGWQKEGIDKRYYVNLDGTLASGWTKINDYTYYFNEDGTPYSGWLNDMGSRYYIKNNGQVATGVWEVNDTYYTFSDEGKLITSEELAEHIDEIPLNDDTDPDRKTVSDNKIYTFGGYEMEFEDRKALLDVIGEMDSSGNRTIGFVMINLLNGKGIGYNVDEKVYSASCIKGPYIAALVDSRPEILEKSSNTLVQVVMNSDNQLYSNLRRSYGRQFFEEWCISADVDQDVSVYNYPRLSARNLAKLWVKNYYFFNTDEVGMQIRDWYTSPNASAIYSSLGKGSETKEADSSESASLGYRTESKAGWFCESSKPYATATTDGGIIYPDDNSAYAIAIITDFPSDMKRLEPLCVELNELYKKTK